MTIPSTLTTADVLRLLPALEKWDKLSAIRLAQRFANLNPGCLVQYGEPFGRIKSVTIPSDIVTREMGFTNNGLFCNEDGSPNGKIPKPRPAIVISTEPNE